MTLEGRADFRGGWVTMEGRATLDGRVREGSGDVCNMQRGG